MHMPSDSQLAWLSRLKPRTKRMLVYLVVLLGIAAWRFVPRPWHPTTTVQTAHYKILSTATPTQTEEIGRVIEVLYAGYSNRFAQLPGIRPPAEKHQMKLYKERNEFRRINPGLSWAEAFYGKPYCQAYYSATEANPYHWMVHEGVHQLNEELAHLDLAKWLEEGLAEYMSTCFMTNGTLLLGSIDPETYPVWWHEELATSDSLQENLKNGSVIPLRSIITGWGGPSMRRHVNLYYLHWWSLTHYVFETHPKQAVELLKERGRLAAFERLIGPVDQAQLAWHAHVRRIKATLSKGERWKPAMPSEVSE
jgi:hypothetical protein